jgi:hypothetical protein
MQILLCQDANNPAADAVFFVRKRNVQTWVHPVLSIPCWVFHFSEHVLSLGPGAHRLHPLRPLRPENATRQITFALVVSPM